MEQPPSELCSAVCDVNETPLCCRGQQCGRTYPVLSYMEMNGAAGFDIYKKIVIFTLFGDILSKVLEKTVNFNFNI